MKSIVKVRPQPRRRHCLINAVVEAVSRKQSLAICPLAPPGEARDAIDGAPRRDSSHSPSQQTPNAAVWLIEGAPDLVQRLTGFPSAPDVVLLDRSESKPFSCPHTTPPLTADLRLNRSASTVSREISRHGGRPTYRTHVADDQAWDSALRPKRCLLAVSPKLRNIVTSNTSRSLK
jgi:hypothetical protein